jgi:hypothetical protein
MVCPSFIVFRGGRFCVTAFLGRGGGVSRWIVFWVWRLTWRVGQRKRADIAVRPFRFEAVRGVPDRDGGIGYAASSWKLSTLSWSWEWLPLGCL